MCVKKIRAHHGLFWAFCPSTTSGWTQISAIIIPPWNHTLPVFTLGEALLLFSHWLRWGWHGKDVVSEHLFYSGNHYVAPIVWGSVPVSLVPSLLMFKYHLKFLFQEATYNSILNWLMPREAATPKWLLLHPMATVRAARVSSAVGNICINLWGQLNLATWLWSLLLFPPLAQAIACGIKKSWRPAA